MTSSASLTRSSAASGSRSDVVATEPLMSANRIVTRRVSSWRDAATGRAAPHAAQNRAPGTASAWQPGQIISRGDRGQEGFLRCLGGYGGQREPEYAAASRLRLGPDPATLRLYDAAADRQAQSGAGYAVICVQTLEDDEHLLGVAGIEPSAVVGDVEAPHRALTRGGNPDLRSAAVVPVLDRVREQVLEQPRQARLADRHSRQRADLDAGIGFPDRRLESLHRTSYRPARF